METPLPILTVNRRFSVGFPAKTESVLCAETANPHFVGFFVCKTCNGLINNHNQSKSGFTRRKTIMKKFALILPICLLAFGSVANAQVATTFTNTISGNFASWGDIGSPLNSHEDFADCSAWLAADPLNFATIDSISWDIDIDPQGLSWYSEAALNLEVDGVDFQTIQFLPDDDFANDGIVRNATGTVDFTTGGVAGTGVQFADLDYEFFELFDDGGDTVRDAFLTGSISVTFTHGTVPEPSSAILLAGLGLGLIRRRR